MVDFNKIGLDYETFFVGFLVLLNPKSYPAALSTEDLRHNFSCPCILLLPNPFNLLCFYIPEPKDIPINE